MIRVKSSNGLEERERDIKVSEDKQYTNTGNVCIATTATERLRKEGRSIA